MGKKAAWWRKYYNIPMNCKYEGMQIMLKSLNLLVWMMIFSVLIPAGSAASEPENSIIIGYTGSLEGKYREPSLMGQKAFQLWGREEKKKGRRECF